jgi:hypothetical protein
MRTQASRCGNTFQLHSAYSLGPPLQVLTNPNVAWLWWSNWALPWYFQCVKTPASVRCSCALNSKMVWIWKLYHCNVGWLFTHLKPKTMLYVAEPSKTKWTHLLSLYFSIPWTHRKKITARLKLRFWSLCECTEKVNSSKKWHRGIWIQKWFVFSSFCLRPTTK